MVDLTYPRQIQQSIPDAGFSVASLRQQDIWSHAAPSPGKPWVASRRVTDDDFTNSIMLINDMAAQEAVPMSYYLPPPTQLAQGRP